MAKPDSFAVELGLGGSYRQILINETYNCGTWTMGDLKGTRMRDISGRRNHGTYTGSGFTRGVTGDLPEGNLGCTGDGNGHGVVPDDSATATVLNMSLAGGRYDVAFLFKTTTNDATLRCIAGKQVTNSSGNGWFVGLQSGALVGFLRVSGSTIFNFARGSVSDGNWHLGHLHYNPDSGFARWYIDGVASGSDVSASTEAVSTNADFRVYKFTDGAGAFLGTLSMVMIGREGNATLSASLQAARTWTNVSADVRTQMPIAVRYGMTGTSPIDNVASSGTLSFGLDNTTNNAGAVVGYYSPRHASVRAGFKLGIPARFSITYSGTTYYKFRGRVKSVRPIAGSKRERVVMVTCVDWMAVAGEVALTALATQTNALPGYLFGLCVDEADGRSPVAVSIDEGEESLPYAFDVGALDEENYMLSEFARIEASARGYVFIKGDTTQGGTLVRADRTSRTIAAANVATFSNTMSDLEIGYDLDSLINSIRVTVYPRTVDGAATTVLYQLAVSATTQAIAPGQTIVLEGSYRDPDQPNQPNGATDIVTPVAGTDYTMHANNDGSGTVLTSSFDVVFDVGGSAFRATLTNSGATPGFITLFRVRGRGIHRDTAVTVQQSNADSVREFGPRVLTLDMPYQTYTAIGQVAAEQILASFEGQTDLPDRLTIFGNASSALLIQALAREVGDKIGIAETVSGLTTATGFYINEVSLLYDEGGVVQTSWRLAPPIDPWDTIPFVTYSGPTSGEFLLTGGGALVLSTPGTYSIGVNVDTQVIVKGVAGGGGGGLGGSGGDDQAGGGGGGGAANTTSNVTPTLLAGVTYEAKVGAGGAAGAVGGNTEFRIASSTDYLVLGGGGLGGRPTAGAGGTSSVGTGGVSGGAGGAGGSVRNLPDPTGAAYGTAGTAASGGGGGGGGGSRGDDPSVKGGDAAIGGAGGSTSPGGGGAGQAATVGANGVTASGLFGSGGQSAGGNGGGGGGGGGVTLGGVAAGGGGGGGGGADGATPGGGGAGGPGVLTIVAA